MVVALVHAEAEFGIVLEPNLLEDPFNDLQLSDPSLLDLLRAVADEQNVRAAVHQLAEKTQKKKRISSEN